MSNPQRARKVRRIVVFCATIFFPGITFVIGSIASQVNGTARLIYIIAGFITATLAAYFALHIKRKSNSAQLVEFGESLCAIMEHLAWLAENPTDAAERMGRIRDKAVTLLATHVSPTARCAFYALESNGACFHRRGSSGNMKASETYLVDNGPGSDLLYMMQRKNVISIPDTHKTNGNPSFNLGDDYRTAIVAPVYAGEDAKGVLILDAPKVDDLADVHESLVRMFANILAVTQAATPAHYSTSIGEQKTTHPTTSSQSGESSPQSG
ncbi:GAF domain-containing protein [Streptomyces sp. CdTB01]|uniref:GAF domain-containing protein n=1 Tax=Streptomyces sp. CdTB01 TaxID=1725411 RepID=UPI000AA7F068|nr:GAF domain-containing protein [Streptomyces sp. CdTB01]